MRVSISLPVQPRRFGFGVTCDARRPAGPWAVKVTPSSYKRSPERQPILWLSIPVSVRGLGFPESHPQPNEAAHFGDEPTSRKYRLRYWDDRKALPERPALGFSAPNVGQRNRAPHRPPAMKSSTVKPASHIRNMYGATECCGQRPARLAIFAIKTVQAVRGVAALTVSV